MGRQKITIIKIIPRLLSLETKYKSLSACKEFEINYNTLAIIMKNQKH
jgi:hypothetical protein